MSNVSNNKNVPFSEKQKSDYTTLINSKLNLIPIFTTEDLTIASVALKTLAQRTFIHGNAYQDKLIKKIKVLYDYQETCVSPINQNAFKALLDEHVNKRAEKFASFNKEQKLNKLQHVNFTKQESLFTPKKEDLINLMRVIYLESSEKGVCYGLAIMGMKAVLSGTIDPFDLRLNKLALLLNEYPEPKNFTEIVEKIKENKDFDLMAFFEGIELGMRFFVYEELFEKEASPEKSQLATDHIEMATKLIASKALEEKGELLNLKNFTGAYIEMDTNYILSELFLYFSSLKESIDSHSLASPSERLFSSQTAPKTPIAFVLRNSQHAITVGYDPLEKNWILVDSFQLHKRNIKEIKEIVQSVKETLHEVHVKAYDGEFDIYPMSTKSYIANKKEDPEVACWQKILNDWQETGKFVSIQRHSPQSALKNGFWLIMAAIDQDEILARDLLTDGAIVDVKVANNHTPLMFAVKTGNIEMIKILLTTGNISAKSLDGTTVLEMAFDLDRNWEQVIEILIEGGADVNERFSDNSTALAQAAARGWSEIASSLLKAGASVNEPGRTGLSPLVLAKDYPEIVEILLKAGAKS